jgi:hypothetical protein
MRWIVIALYIDIPTLSRLYKSGNVLIKLTSDAMQENIIKIRR